MIGASKYSAHHSAACIASRGSPKPFGDARGSTDRPFALPVRKYRSSRFSITTQSSPRGEWRSRLRNSTIAVAPLFVEKIARVQNSRPPESPEQLVEFLARVPQDVARRRIECLRPDRALGRRIRAAALNCFLRRRVD